MFSVRYAGLFSEPLTPQSQCPSGSKAAFAAEKFFRSIPAIVFLISRRKPGCKWLTYAVRPKIHS